MKKETILILCGIVLVLAFLVILFLRFRKKENRIVIDDVFINNLIVFLGGNDNISNVEVDNARLKFVLKNVKLAKLEEIKALATSGVFVTGNVVKTLFKFDSKTIKNAVEKKLKA